MTVRYIVELKAKPGRRDELMRLFETLMTELGPALKERGSLGGSLYKVRDDPDRLFEITDWESAEAHDAVMQDAAAGEALAPVFDLIAGSFTAVALDRVLSIPQPSSHA